jgi:hypothetical protein
MMSPNSVETPGTDVEVEVDEAAVRARDLLEKLLHKGSFEMRPGATGGDLAERLATLLDTTTDPQAIGEWLIDQPEVAELYCEDSEIGEALGRGRA